MAKSETFYLTLSPGITAKLEVQIVIDPSCPTPNELPTRRVPSPREMDRISQQLAKRAWRFTPED